MKSYTLRPAAPADDPFLLAVYASTRAAELAMVPWTDAQKETFLQMQTAAQRQHYQASYPTGQHLLILCGEEAVGRLWLDRQPDRIHLLDITLLPRHRNSGIGGALLKDLQAEAAGSGQAITVYVESFSPSVPFFVRLGFVHAGQTGAHLLLRWEPRIA